MEIKCDKLEWPTVPCQSPSECGIYRGIVASRLSLSLSLCSIRAYSLLYTTGRMPNKVISSFLVNE